MGKPHPPVFVSATSVDLARVREVIRDALLEVGCHPVIQQHFSTGQGDITSKEARDVAESKAVIHVAGRYYGKEPGLRNVERGRRSYTQLEYDIAVELGKPLYVFLATDAFYADSTNFLTFPLPEEDQEAIKLQQKHREKLRKGNCLYYEFSSLDEVRELVLKLPERSDSWHMLFQQERRYHLLTLTSALLMVGAIAVFAWHRSERMSRQLDTIRETSLTKDQIRDLLKEVQSSDEGRGVDLDLQLAALASRHGLTEQQLQQSFKEFVRQYELDKTPSAEDTQLRNVAAKFIMQGFSADEFADYVEKLQFSEWEPDFVVLHHTVMPTLSQWMTDPPRRLASMRDFVVKGRGWSGGPHLFIDETKIWVFNSLTTPGIHASTWNKQSIGIEMVGNYDDQILPDSVRDLTVAAIAILDKKLELPAESLRFHGEQGKNNCPGKNVSKEVLVERIGEKLRDGTSSSVVNPDPVKPPSDSTNSSTPPVVDPWKGIAPDTRKKVVGIFVGQLGVIESEITPTARLVEDLGGDSLDCVEIVMAIEDEFGISLPDDSVAGVKTVGDFARVIEIESAKAKSPDQ